MMYIRDHGGWCCGITHIMGFNDPNSRMCESKELSKYPESIQHALTTGTYSGVQYIKRPEEPAKQRFKALLAHAKSLRRSGIIECVLTDSQLNTWDWRTILEKEGFKEVNSAINSNSLRRLHVFHLNHGRENIPPKQTVLPETMEA